MEDKAGLEIAKPHAGQVLWTTTRAWCRESQIAHEHGRGGRVGLEAPSGLEGAAFYPSKERISAPNSWIHDLPV